MEEPHSEQFNYMYLWSRTPMEEPHSDVFLLCQPHDFTYLRFG